MEPQYDCFVQIRVIMKSIIKGLPYTTMRALNIYLASPRKNDIV